MQQMCSIFIKFHKTIKIKVKYPIRRYYGIIKATIEMYERNKSRKGLRKLSELEKLPNIGKVAASLLTEAGIDTPDKLVKTGSKEAFLRIREIDPTACIRMLYGLEGAVKGLPDKLLPQESKEELLSFFRSL